MIEKINKILEKLPEEYRDSIREIVEIIIKEEIEQNRKMIKELWKVVKEGNKESKKVWQAINKLTERVDDLTKGIRELRQAIKESNDRMDRMEQRMNEEFQRIWKAIESLTQAVNELREITKQHSERIEKLEKAVMELTQAVSELRQSVNELREITKQHGERIEKLEKAVMELTQAVSELREITKEHGERIYKLEQKVEQGFQDMKKYIDNKISSLGARWGIESENTFRNSIAYLLKDMGFKVEKLIFFDDEGYVFSKPSTIEIDLIITNGKTIAIEIKSSVDKSDIFAFEKKVQLYEMKFKRKIDDKIFISPFVYPGGVLELAQEFNIKIINEVEKGFI
ncbi:MAG: DUF3782 domain-containing protein [candidate division WOR-3 bacterium]